MRPLSIFSFETLRLRGFWPWGLVLALLVGLLIELGAARSATVWSAVPNTPTGLMATLDQVAAEVSDPKVIVLGNSRLINGVLPFEMDQIFGFEVQSSYNFSLMAGRPFDFLTFYRDHRNQLSRSRLLIVGLDDNIFGQKMDSAEQRFRFRANLPQRWNYQGGTRLSFIAGGLVRSLDAGGTWWGMTKTVVRGRADVSLTPDLRIERSNIREFGPTEASKSRFNAVIDRNYSQYEFSPSQLKYLLQLIDLAQEDGLKVVLVRPPVRDAYLKRVLELEPTQFAIANEVYNQLPIRPWLYGSARELAMQSKHFVDYGHFSTVGGRRFTKILAKRIGKKYPEFRGPR